MLQQKMKINDTQSSQREREKNERKMPSMLNTGVFSSLILQFILFFASLLMLCCLSFPVAATPLIRMPPFFCPRSLHFTMMFCYFCFCLSDENHIVLRCDTHFYYTL